jgi:hypothetical protein
VLDRALSTYDYAAAARLLEQWMQMPPPDASRGV